MKSLKEVTISDVRQNIVMINFNLTNSSKKITFQHYLRCIKINGIIFRNGIR